MKRLVAVLIVALSGCATGQVFKENVNRLQSWMNPEQVEALLGSPDREELKVCGLVNRWKCLAWTYTLSKRNALGWPYTKYRLQVFFRNATDVARGYSEMRVTPSIMVYRCQQGPTWILEKWNWL
jgi:hypothetical protein